MIATVTRAGQVTVWAWRSTRNWSLANRPPGAVGSWVLTIGVSPWLLQPGQVGAGAIGAVAIDHRLGGLLALAWDQVVEQPGRDRRVAGGWPG